MKQKIIDGIIYTFAAIGVLTVLWTIPQVLHRTQCDCYQKHAKWAQENGCSWFWCDHYNGK